MRAWLAPMAFASACAVIAPGCAAQFTGTLEGEPVPDFRTAAFGEARGLAGSQGHIALGVLMPKDSCDDGALALALQRRGSQSSSIAEQRQHQRQMVDFVEERLPEDSWYGFMVFQSNTGNSLDDGVYKVGSGGDTNIQMQLCRRGRLVPLGFSIFGSSADDCYTTTAGRLDVAVDVDAIDVRSEDTIRFSETTGADEDELGVAINLRHCDALTEELEKLLSPR
jgi:hypothetical protein